MAQWKYAKIGKMSNPDKADMNKRIREIIEKTCLLIRWMKSKEVILLLLEKEK